MIDNREGGRVETAGDGSRGMDGRTRGAESTVRVVNAGSVTTGGDPVFDADRRAVWAASGVRAHGEGIGSGAQATNEARGVIRTAGDGARALEASVCFESGAPGCDPTGRGTAVARNLGTILTTGDAYSPYDGGFWSPNGVFARAAGDGASALAVNEEGGTIRTEGAGAIALSAFVPRGDGAEAAVVENGGAIVTTGGEGVGGFRSTGMRAIADTGGGRGWNRASGQVHTMGFRARGVSVGSRGEGATAQAVNDGVIRTDGGRAPALHAWRSRTSGGRAVVENRATGRIETGGDTSAFGALVWLDGPAALTGEAANEGRILTRGFNSEGVLVVAHDGGTAESPHVLHAVNREGGRIVTEGEASSGIETVVGVRGAGVVHSFAGATTENHGTIMTAGGTEVPADVDAVFRLRRAANGVGASVFPWDEAIDTGGRPDGRETPEGTVIGNGGDVTVVNTGEVTVTGGSAGLLALTYGTGTATVRMTGGRVTSGALDDPATAEDESRFGVGIVAVALTGSTAGDPLDDEDVLVTVAGGAGTAVTAHGAEDDDPATLDWDESRGVGIYGRTGASGHMVVDVSGGATVTAERAGVFEGGRTTFTLGDGSVLVGDLEFAGLDDRLTVGAGRIEGDIRFGGGADTLTVRNGRIEGDVHFGEGTDTLVLDVPVSGGIDGRVTGLEELFKRGGGLGAIFDAEFSGSALVVEDGELSVTGHLDLGSEGTLTVHDPSRLSLVVGDLVADAGDHARITAGGGVVYEGLAEDEAPAMYLQLRAGLRDDAGAVRGVLEESPIDVLGEGTRVRRQTGSGPVDVDATDLRTADPDGGTRAIGTVERDGVVRLAAGATLGGQAPEAGRGGSGGGGANAGLLLAGGGALLAGLVFDALDDEEAARADFEEAARARRPVTSFGSVGSGLAPEHRVRSGGLEPWTRSFAGDAPIAGAGGAGVVRGLATGLDARLGGGFRVGVTAAPELAVAAGPGSAARLAGSHLSVRAGWSGASLFAGASLARGRYRTRSLFADPAAGGVLGGETGLVASRVRGRAGVRLGFGSLRVTPSVALFAGTLRQDAHLAGNASLRAEVPAVSRRYDGWKAGLDLAPAGWLEGPRRLRWRPALHLSSTRTRTHGPAAVDLRRSDRAGVLGFSSRAGVRALPRTVHGFGAGLTAMRSGSWRLRLGYAGLVVDGEPVHAAAARLHVRF